MKKIASFIVDRKAVILPVMLAITILCGILFFKVEINNDLTKYLPDSSQMKQGMDIMNEEFSSVEISKTIRAMVDDLSPEEKLQVRDELEKLSNVSEVEYKKNDAAYNIDNHTLFIVSTPFDYGTAEENQLEKDIDAALSGYEHVVRNDDTATDRLPPIVIISALVLIFIILFLMSASWTEPFLFLITIGMAIVINLGTNIIQGSISNVTFMIAALLQLVLSMDYSIILTNRFRQELAVNPDRKEAMKAALANSFSSISGSSVTTVVGLLALVFMSFRIGLDLGVVLAKGVAISMICVFTILPGLIVIAFPLIQKTSKRVLNIPMGKLGALSYRLRIPALVVFVALFCGSFYARQFTETVFTLDKNDPIAEIFPNKNTIVLIYDSRDDEAATSYLTDLEEGDSSISSIMSYSKTLGNEVTAEKLGDLISDMGEDAGIDSSMLKLLYYDYFSGGKAVDAKVGDFIEFIADDVATNEQFRDQISDEMRDNLERFRILADKDGLLEEKPLSEIAELFGTDEDMLKKLMVLYYADKGDVETGKLTLSEFADYVANEVSANEEYSSMFDQNTLAMTKRMLTFTDVGSMTYPVNYTTAAYYLGIEPDMMKMLYVYCFGSNPSYDAGTMTLPDFVDYILNDVANDPTLSSRMDSAMTAQLSQLAPFTDVNVIQAPLHSSELAQYLGMDESMVQALFQMAFPTDISDKTMTLPEFTGFLVNAMADPAFAEMLDDASRAQITQMHQLCQLAVSGEELDANGLGMILGLDPAVTANILAMKGAATSTLPEFTDFLVSSVLPNPAFAPYFDDTAKAQLGQMDQLLKLAASGQQMTADMLATTLGMDTAMAQQVFTMYYADTGDRTMSLVEFASLLLQLSENPQYAAMLDESSIAQIRMLSSIMNASMEGKTFTPEELSAMFGTDASQLRLLFAMKNSATEAATWTLSMQQLVNYMLANQETFSAMMAPGQFSQLYLLSALINGSVAGTEYDSATLARTLSMDETMLRQLFLLHDAEHGDTSRWKISLDSFVTFVQDEILTNEEYADRFESEDAKQIPSARKLMDAVISEKSYSTEELTELFEGMTDDFDSNRIELLSLYYSSERAYDDSWKLSIHTLFSYMTENILNDPRFDEFIDAETRDKVGDYETTIDEALEQLSGENYSRAIITSTYSDESKETTDFIGALSDGLDSALSGDHYLIGSSVMNYEMQRSFDREMLTITLITAIAIFLVVLVTFRRVLIALILVLIVQCGVYVTVVIIGLQGYSIYFLALLIVQCILMGATIDYGILFANYYCESRQTMGIKDSVIAAYNGSIHTIMTSGLILILVTGIVGKLFENPTIGQICSTISKGAISACVLILLILPGMLAVFDRLIIRNRRRKDE